MLTFPIQNNPKSLQSTDALLSTQKVLCIPWSIPLDTEFSYANSIFSPADVNVRVGIYHTALPPCPLVSTVPLSKSGRHVQITRSRQLKLKTRIKAPTPVQRRHAYLKYRSKQRRRRVQSKHKTLPKALQSVTIPPATTEDSGVGIEEPVSARTSTFIDPPRDVHTKSDILLSQDAQPSPQPPPQPPSIPIPSSQPISPVSIPQPTSPTRGNHEQIPTELPGEADPHPSLTAEIFLATGRLFDSIPVPGMEILARGCRKLAAKRRRHPRGH